MFEEINRIDWYSLGFESIPKVMKDLLSENRDSAYDILHESIVIGDSGYDNWNLRSGISRILKSDLHLALTPFLIELLDFDEISNKEYEYDILIDFVAYVDFRDEGEIYYRRAWKIRNSVWKGKEIFVKHLSSENNKTRLGSFALLCSFNEHYEELIPILLDRIRLEQSMEVKLDFVRRFYHAYVLWNLLSESQMKIWNDVKPVADEELFHPLYKWVYTKHEITNSIE
jgi:hypothetical protein